MHIFVSTIFAGAGHGQPGSAQGRKDDAFLTLLGDIYAHLGDNAHAAEIFRDAIARNPDNDQNYLSLALIDLRSVISRRPRRHFRRANPAFPLPGRSTGASDSPPPCRGNTSEAARQLERATELLPEWSGGYSTLGVFYFQIGQNRESPRSTHRFKESSASGSLEIDRIQQVLDRAPASVRGMKP